MGKQGRSFASSYPNFPPVVLMLRTYAIWGRKRWVLYVLIMLVLVSALPVGYRMVLTSARRLSPFQEPLLPIWSWRPSYVSPKPVSFPLLSDYFVDGPSPNNRCSLKHASTIIYIAYVLFILCETGEVEISFSSAETDNSRAVIVSLTAVKAWQHRES